MEPHDAGKVIAQAAVRATSAYPNHYLQQRKGIDREHQNVSSHFAVHYDPGHGNRRDRGAVLVIGLGTGHAGATGSLPGRRDAAVRGVHS
jgi:hypothetical protein